MSDPIELPLPSSFHPDETFYLESRSYRHDEPADEELNTDGATA